MRDVFQCKDIDRAKDVILTADFGMTTEERWEKETPVMVDTLDRLIAQGSMVLDFGVGIGRIAKGLLEKRQDINIVGIDDSDEMRAHCRGYCASDRLELKKSLKEVPTGSIDFAYAIYVLQHVQREDYYIVMSNLNWVMKTGSCLYLLNMPRRVVFDSKDGTFKDDGLPQDVYLSRYFKKVCDVTIDSPVMKKVMEIHRSELYRKVR